MKKLLIKIFIIIYTIIPLINTQAIDTYSQNAILYNMNDDKIIYEKNAYEQVKIASLTKIMTTIVALENIENIKQTVIMPKEAYKGLEGYATSGIKAGEKVTYEDLLYGIMLPSGADCANGIAILTEKTIDNFVEKMNKKAKELNLTNTHFSNPIGMDEDNYSTVNEIAMLLKYALKNETFYKIFTTREYKTTNNIMLKSTIIEKSKKINIDPINIIGSKTGFTDDAGNCLATISKINNVKYLLVTTNANTTNSYHILDAINIYDYYSKNYGYKKILNYNQYLTSITIKGKEYKIYSNNDIYMYLNNFIKDLTYEYNGITEINDNIKKGEKIGTILIKNENEILTTYDIFLDKNIQNSNYIFFVIPLVILLLFIIVKNIIYKIKNI